MRCSEPANSSIRVCKLGRSRLPPKGDRVPQWEARVSSRAAWTAIGPKPIGAGLSGFGTGTLPNSGRVTSVAVVDASTAYIGAAGGGVWKTTDGGTTWTPLTDTGPAISTGAVGSIALDPNNSNIVYVGLGEENFSSDSYYGYGILKSTDAGASWTLVSPEIFSRSRIGRIAVDPNNSSILYAAVCVQSASTAGIAKTPMGVPPGLRPHWAAYAVRSRTW